MPGNSKTRRKSSSQSKGQSRTATASAITPLLPMHRIAPFRQLAQMHKSVMHCVEHMANQTATEQDWLDLHRRLYLGSIAIHDYCTANPGANHVMNQGNLALQIAKMRSILWDTLGFTPQELDSVVDALELTDRVVRTMAPKEVNVLYLDTEVYIQSILRNNKKAFPQEPVPSVVNPDIVELEEAT